MSKVYKCQFCSFHGTKEKLVSHVESKHPEMIPEGFTAGRTVFNYINHKDHGVCVVCKRQEKMLKNRRISGKYRFTDGGYCTYTGKYELKTLEFLDKVLGYTSNEILTPGPIVEYEYQGKKLNWILDILIIPYNLVIDVKDGGDNPNNREMKSYREKQIAKESDIKKLGEFNYLRLTNNNFEQLIHILAELKMQMIDSTYEDGKTIIRVHEEYIEEASGLKKLHCLPIDTTQCKPNEYVGCFNTHIINQTKAVAINTAVWTLINMAFGVPFFNALKTMTILMGILNFPAYAEQLFARDFILINKNPKKDITDDFEGFKVLSCNDGIVELAKKGKMPYGNVIVIKHDDHLYSVYAHLATKGILVKEGQKVKKGQVIGIAGSTGNSTAPHLHFQLLLTSMDYMPIGRPLNGFEPFYTKNASNNMLDLTSISKFLNITNGKWKLDTTGEIPSFCVIKSQNDLHEEYIEEASGIKKKTSYEGMLTNQDELTWRKKIKILYLDKEKIIQLGYPEEYANKPQPCIFIEGKKYRARAEMLLLNDNGEVLIQEGKERAFPYTVCGGGIDDPTEDSKYAAIRECEEEALIVPKDVEFTGIIWFMKYHNKIKANDGAVVFLYIGKYDKPYKGYVKKIDRDSFATKSKWVKIKDAKLGEPHQVAINNYENGRYIERVYEDYIEEAADPKYSKQYHSVDEFCQYIKSPEELSRWLFFNKVNWPTESQVRSIERKKNFKRTEKEGNNIMVIWPEDIFKYKIAICFDYAIFANLCCKRYGLNSGILLIAVNVNTRLFSNKRDMIGHAVCIYEK